MYYSEFHNDIQESRHVFNVHHFSEAFVTFGNIDLIGKQTIVTFHFLLCSLLRDNRDDESEIHIPNFLNAVITASSWAWY